jgi:hypothetical protein
MRLSLQDIKAACDGLASSRTLKKTQWSAMSMKELIAAQKAILSDPAEIGAQAGQAGGDPAEIGAQAS